MGKLSPESTLSEVEACRRRIEKRSHFNGVFGQPLAFLLGFKSVRSYQRAALNGSLPKIPLYPLPGRKGKYAYSSDLAALVVKRAIKDSASWERLVDDAFCTPLTRLRKRRTTISEA